MTQFTFSEKISLLLAVQLPQIPLNQLLTLLRFAELFMPLGNLVLKPLHPAVCLIVHPPPALLKAGLLLFQRVDFFCALGKNLLFLLRQRLNFLHILQIGGHHIILKLKILKLL